MEAFVLSHDFGTEYYGVDEDLRTRWREGNLVNGEVSFNLRCDWSLNEKYDDPDRIRDLVLNVMKEDWLDLLENGEQANTNDALYKSMDGVKVRGFDPLDVQIIFGSLYREYREKNKCWDYTLYFRPYVKWWDLT